jgi:signal transduction histidine kinase
MLEHDEPYGLAAWSAQFDRIRLDLNDALRLEQQAAVATRTPDQQKYLADSVAQFWSAADRIFATAREGCDDEARAQVRLSLQARQAALSATVARLLVQNNEAEEETAGRIRAIYQQVQRQVYWFAAATLLTILLSSLYVIRSNRRFFASLAALSDERRELAQQLIAAREATLREISRELHDELGQVLTAIGSMIGRIGRQLPAESPLQADLLEVRTIAQTTLDQVRSLSQTLHPSTLEDAGLDATVEWYLTTVERQLGLHVSYERTGSPLEVGSAVAVHVYRVLQEALSNVARHSGSERASVRLHGTADQLRLEVEDRGSGMDTVSPRRGLGIIGMRERAALMSGSIEFERPPAGGTLVRLTVPMPSAGTPHEQVRSIGAPPERAPEGSGSDGGQVGRVGHTGPINEAGTRV